MKLTKLNGMPIGWDAGATSANKLFPYQNGWIEVRANGTCFFGLNIPNVDPDFASILYGVYIQGSNLRYIENGIQIESLGSVASEDIIRMERLGAEIIVKQNGIVLKTISVDPSQELVADCSLYSPGQEWFVLDGRASFPASSESIPQTIEWTSLVNTALDPLDPTKIYKSGAGGAWDGGAISANKLPPGQNGWVEFTAGNATVTKAIVGLSIESPQPSFKQMTYGVYMKDVLKYFEEGVVEYGNIGEYTEGDKIRLERIGSKLYISKNGTIIHTTSVNPDVALMAEVAFYNKNWFVQGAVASFENDNSYQAIWKPNNNDTYFDAGNVGIGTSSIPEGYLLGIQGKAIMEEVKVQLSENWPDYVFEEGYDLRTLQEIKAYISENKHLPDVPAAREVEAAGGIEIGAMNVLLLRKIEEMMLYQIGLTEMLENQMELIEDLQNAKSERDSLVEHLHSKINTLENAIFNLDGSLK